MMTTNTKKNNVDYSRRMAFRKEFFIVLRAPDVTNFMFNFCLELLSMPFVSNGFKFQLVKVGARFTLA